MNNKISTIPKGWKGTTLGEVAEKIIDHRGMTPKKLGSDWSLNGKYRALSAKSVKTGGLINEGQINLVDETLYRKWMKDEICFNDILLTSEAPMGEVLIWKSDEKIVLSQRLFAIRSKSDVSSDYLYQYLKSPIFQGELLKRSSGTTVTGIKQSELLKTKIILPSLPEQRAIAAVLSSLDDKIELLREQNKTLEATAQAIFKEWFVNFNFPGATGKMIDSELGKIPEGWRVGKFSDYIQELVPGEWGQDIQDESFSSKVICLRGTDLADIKYGSVLRAPIRFINDSKLEKVELKNGDLIVEISGGTIGQSTGRIAYFNSEITDRLKLKVVTSNFCKILRLEDPRFQPFVYFYWEYFYKTGLFFNFENGTTGIQNLDLKSFLENDFVVPDENACHKYCAISNKILIKIQHNNSQILALSNLRDALLPKLMRGEIKINHYK